MCRALNLLLDKQQEINKIRKDLKRYGIENIYFYSPGSTGIYFRKGNNTMSYN